MGSDSTSIADRLGEVRARVARAAMASGRAPEAVRLIAVSKKQTAAAIREAYDAGQRIFGENYVQELVAKAAALTDADGLVWHAIGPLQRNKAKDVVRVATAVHTVDRAALADELAKRTTRSLDVLLEVNIAGEAQKAGVAPAAAEALADHVRALPSLRLVGLMAIPPAADDPQTTRVHFAALRALGERLRARGHVALTELSMGMSRDFEVAIAEGATLVRVGTAIFGERPER